jgi:hypothetical protein
MFLDFNLNLYQFDEMPCLLSARPFSCYQPGECACFQTAPGCRWCPQFGPVRYFHFIFIDKLI